MHRISNHPDTAVDPAEAFKYTPGVLADMGDVEFSALVGGNVAPEAPPLLWQHLTNWEIIARTGRALQEEAAVAERSIRRRAVRLEALGARATDGDASAAAELPTLMAEFAGTDEKAIRFVGRCAVRMADLRERLNGICPDGSWQGAEARRATENLAAFRVLIRAVAAHRDGVADDLHGDGVELDKALWDVLDGLDVVTERTLVTAEDWATVAERAAGIVAPFAGHDYLADLPMAG